MTQVLLVRCSNGELKACSAKGHSGYSVRGSDIVCASVTTLLRTTLTILENTAGLDLGVKATLRGKLAFKVKKLETIPVDSRKKLVFACDFLETGFQRLEKEYPAYVSFRVQIID
ncbi:MAG TPA: ribosomal-processing cysteine protease Prp [Treponemataceae bacterium]|nr:ribosomal-processing cysteine protease Prp [Treponemataceae bacterium]